MSKKPFYITTAIAYASKKPHIGNTYEVVFTDAVARFKRMQGYDVYFLTGTDEHGLKIEELAKAEGISPKEHVDKVVGEIKDICSIMNISYDGFIRTTDEQHEKVVQKIFKKLSTAEIFIKAHMRAFTVLPVRVSGLLHSLLTASALIAEEKCSLQTKRHTS